VSEAVNARRPDYYRYVADRDERRQRVVSAAYREVRARAPEQSGAIIDGFTASVAAGADFDEREPLLTYDQWKEAAGA
jgi:hypothetical protein